MPLENRFAKDSLDEVAPVVNSNTAFKKIVKAVFKVGRHGGDHVLGVHKAQRSQKCCKGSPSGVSESLKKSSAPVSF